MVRIIVWVVGALVLVVAGLWLFQRRLIYLPTQQVPPISDVAPGWEEARFETEDGLTLNGWYLPPQPVQPVVLVFNGNAGNRSDELQPCSSPGFRVTRPRQDWQMTRGQP